MEKKSPNKNHFYEMVEEEKSPLSVSLVTFGFDLIVPLFFLTEYEVSARMHVQHAKHAQISDLMMWL